MKRILGYCLGAFAIPLFIPSYLWVLGIDLPFYTGDRGAAGVIFGGMMIAISVMLWE